jgi:hypothetical protein
MSVSVNPPPQLKIPQQFLDDPELRSYFERERTILWQLWQRTGGAFDSVAGKQIVTVTSSDLIVDVFGGLIVVEADTAAVQVSLPAITSNNIGETVDVAILDATFDTTVVGQGATVLGDASVLMNQQFMSIQYTAISTTVWIGT